MGATVESHFDFAFGDRHISGHVDEVAEDLPCLAFGVSAHALGKATIQPAGDHRATSCRSPPSLTARPIPNPYTLPATSHHCVRRPLPLTVPPALKSKAIAAKWRFIEKTTDNLSRLRTALGLIELGEPSLDAILKDAMAGLPDGGLHNLVPYLRPALKYLQEADPTWVSEWVENQDCRRRPLRG